MGIRYVRNICYSMSKEHQLNETMKIFTPNISRTEIIIQSVIFCFILLHTFVLYILISYLVSHQVLFGKRLRNHLKPVVVPNNNKFTVFVNR